MQGGSQGRFLDVISCGTKMCRRGVAAAEEEKKKSAELASWKGEREEERENGREEEDGMRNEI